MMAIRSTVRNLYYLKLIEPTSNQVNSRAFTRDAVREWLDDLPTVNNGMVTRHFHNKINQINDTIIDFKEQFETLEAIQPTYYKIEVFLHSKICGQSLPLSMQVRKIVELHIQILQDYANAYWYLLKTGSVQLSGRSFAKLKPILIQRLIRLLSNILKTHYLATLAEPTWIWMDIHSLFNMLPDKVCNNTKIKEYSASGVSITTLADTYKQIIALSTSDPFGMYDQEILRVNHYLTRWAPAIKLEKIAPGQIPLGYFVCMDNDKAPCWADIDIDIDEDSDTYQIFMDDMIEIMIKEAAVMRSALGRYYAAIAVPFSDNSFNPELIKHLQQHWKGKPVRQQVLFDSSLHWEVAIGINAISHALQNTEKPLLRAETATEESLKCPLDSDTRIKIGSLVGYRKANTDKKQFGLGLISRIITASMESVTQFELKNITSCVQSVTIELVTEDNKETVKNESLATPALSFSKQSNGDKHFYLVVESRNFKVNDTIVINDANNSYGAVLVKQNNLVLGYVVIEHENITKVKQVEAVPATGYDFL